MKLTKKHIGGLFACRGSDGSWVYQLVDVKKDWLLFYSFSSHISYYKERKGAYSDWMPFESLKPWPKRWLERGWSEAREK